jgi:hypothetical protein
MIRETLALLFLLLSPDTKVKTCHSTVFGTPGDKLAGGNAIYIRRKVNSEDIGVAHRTLPLGHKIVVQNPKTGKIAIATVIDRGPYGAIYDGEWVSKRTKDDPGEWRGCLDLTPALAKAIGHNGFQRVKVFY